MSSLSKIYRAATKRAHEREFLVGEDKITLPRLNLMSQGEFEAFVREDVPGFTLAKTRSRAQFAQADVMMEIAKEIQGDAKIQEEMKSAENKEDVARFYAMQHHQKFAKIMEGIFDVFTRKHIVKALEIALRQKWGNTVEIGDEDVKIDTNFTATLFDSSSDAESAFVYVVGLIDDAKTPEGKEATPETLEEMAKELQKDAEGLGQGLSGKTTSSSSQSSQPDTDTKSKKSSNSTSKSTDS